MKKYKNDVVLIAVLLVLAGAGFIAFSVINSSNAGYVRISHNDRDVTLSLSEDTTYTARLGESVNIIEIKNKEVWISEASCPDRLCIRQGHISRKGESVICLPNEVVVTIVDAKENDVDAVVQ